jgi:hypothetical protein
LEEKVRFVWARTEDKDVDRLVGKVILDLGCTKNMDSKFHMTVELYWHVKTLMAQSMKLQEDKLRNISHRMDALERQDSLLITMTS